MGHGIVGQKKTHTHTLTHTYTHIRNNCVSMCVLRYIYIKYHDIYFYLHRYLPSGGDVSLSELRVLCVQIEVTSDLSVSGGLLWKALWLWSVSAMRHSIFSPISSYQMLFPECGPVLLCSPRAHVLSFPLHLFSPHTKCQPPRTQNRKLRPLEYLQVLLKS